MIAFWCGGCGRRFNVPDGFAGRRATCKDCGTPVRVPNARAIEQPATPTTLPAGTKIPLRVRRLRADAISMANAFRGFPLIRVRGTGGISAGATGDEVDDAGAQEVYDVDYFIRGLERGPSGSPVPREHHQAQIRLTADYPRMAPHCRMLTPIFHPNMDAATICVGDHWTAGERLADLVVRIGEMIAYQAYNIKSPLDAEAAMWADLHAAELPIDPRNLRPAEL